MARSRRGGFGPPELRGTLGSLLRTALDQAGAVRDVLERGAREGRSRLDGALAGRRRSEALAELGERVLELIRAGEIDLDELPEVRGLVADLDALDGSHGRRRDDGDDGDDDGQRDYHAADDLDAGDLRAPAVAFPPSRSRFDQRRAGGGRNADADAGATDGTVSSRTWRGAGGADTGAVRVWRPPATAPASHDHDHERRSVVSPLPKPVAAKAGGITFDDDDLADYMHPDDVPSKPRSDD